MNNIAEGFGYKSPKQFAHFLHIARVSGLEVQSLLYVAQDLGYMKKEGFDILYQLTDEIISMIIGLQNHLLKNG